VRRRDDVPGALRRGITLFEVVLALAIFIGALAAISQVLRVGSRASIRAQLASEAVLRSDYKMNEVLSGIIPLQGAQRTPFEDDPDWLWTLNVVDSGTPNLLLLELTVEHSGTGGDLAASFQLTRMVRDPQIYTDAATATTGGTP
jgi:general secretion pathway protein I